MQAKELYKAKFPKGSTVKIASRAELEYFLKTWKFHNKLRSDQLEYSDRLAQIEEVGFYHGGDVLYKLKGVPGIWHERCLESITNT
jgi:hypothetical protein